MRVTKPTTTITILVNGAERRIGTGASLADLLQELELDPQGVVVELNREIVRRPALERTALREGDRVEIVHFVGGG